MRDDPPEVLPSLRVQALVSPWRILLNPVSATLEGGTLMLIATFHVDIDDPAGKASRRFGHPTEARLAFNRAVAQYRREGFEVQSEHGGYRAVVLKGGCIHATVDLRTSCQ